MSQTGLRERKKRRTRDAISDTAIGLFLDAGFERVSITDIAAAADVSRRTLFAYFPTKEDLVIHRFADHETESGEVVRARPDGRGPLDALREHFLDALGRRDPFSGLCDVPRIRGLYRLVLDTPSLNARMLAFSARSERTLADALRDTAGTPEPTATLAAAQIVAVQWTLMLDNQRRMATGESADDAYPIAHTTAEQAFDLLRDGLGQVAI